jgi:hypothetical protein
MPVAAFIRLQSRKSFGASACRLVAYRLKIFSSKPLKRVAWSALRVTSRLLPLGTQDLDEIHSLCGNPSCVCTESAASDAVFATSKLSAFRPAMRSLHGDRKTELRPRPILRKGLVGVDGWRSFVDHDRHFHVVGFEPCTSHHSISCRFLPYPSSTILKKLDKYRDFQYLQKVRPALGGRPAARESGLGTGRGGDVTGSAELLSVV